MEKEKIIELGFKAMFLFVIISCIYLLVESIQSKGGTYYVVDKALIVQGRSCDTGIQERQAAAPQIQEN